MRQVAQKSTCKWLSWVALGVLSTACSRPDGAQPGPSSQKGSAETAAVPDKPAAEGLPPPAAALLPGSPAHHGAELYGRMCAVCHGANGEGYKADQATALAQPDFLASVSDQQIGVAIAQGRKGTTMSAWSKEAGGPLTHGDISALIAFIRSWQRTPAVELDEGPVLGDAESGKAIFARECERCHGPTAPNVRILASQYLKNTSDGYLRHALRTGRPPTPMQSYEQSLGKKGIEDVLAYLRNLPTEQEAPVAARPEPLPFKPVPQYPKGPAPQDFKAFPAMTSVDVVSKQLVSRKAKMLLLDARVPSDYEMEHIAGAYNVPFYDPSPYLDKLPKSTWLVAYCGCPHAESGNLARELMKAGFTQVTVLDEGLWVWKERGHPMRSGREP
jgi:cytochrome c oxidase cbb3-type subunit III